jgi:hypothetical protein
VLFSSRGDFDSRHGLADGESLMKNRKRVAPRLEALESLTVLSSGLAGSAAAAVSPTAGQSATHAIHLQGSATGHYTLTVKNPDIGGDYSITAKGKLTPLGPVVDVTGDITTPGNIAHGKDTGHLTLSTPTRTLSLQLTQTSSRNSSTLMFQFKITGGTRTYSHDKGSGTVSVTFTPDTTPTPVGSSTNFMTGHGTVNVVFRSS